MTTWLWVLWLATIGADRIDFLAGNGPLVLTPFLIFSPLLLTLTALRWARPGARFRLPPGAAAYALLVLLFLGVVLLSVFLGRDTTLAGPRALLLAFQVLVTLVLSVMLANEPHPAALLWRGAAAGLALGVVFSVAQLVLWLGGGGGGGGVINLVPQTYGPFVPRLSGQALDMNRGGLLFLTYAFVLVRFAPRARWRGVLLGLALVGAVATLSRSVLLAFGVAGAVLAVQERRLRLARSTVLLGAVLGAGLVAVLLLSPPLREALVEVGAPVLERFTPRGDRSASEHVALLRRGMEVGTSSVPHALIGIGFGNAYLELQDFFPGSKYGNFHSLYVTLLAESGAVALALVLLLLLLPFRRAGAYLPLLAALVVFNVFYQTLMEPVFWLALALAWLGVGEADPTLRGRTTAPVPARRL